LLLMLCPCCTPFEIETPVNVKTPNVSIRVSVAEVPTRAVAPLALSERVRALRAFLSNARVQLALALLLAAAARLWVIVTAHGMMDGDEAVLGIQAEDILRGAHPIYFTGQAYMGSWDAYLLAPIIAVFGPSANAIHAVTLLESLLLVLLTGALATHLYGARARLPALLLTALPPLYVSVTELRMLGGYTETLVLGAALMLVAVHVMERWEKETDAPTLGLWLLAGFLTGMGLWIDPLIGYYVVACMLWMAPLAFLRLRRHVLCEARWQWWQWGLRSSLTALASLIALLVGASPAIVYALQHHFANIATLTQYSHLDHASTLHGGIARYLVLAAIPRLMSIQLLWVIASGPWKAVCGVLAAVFLLAATGRGVARVLPWRSWSAATWRRRWPEVLPLLLFVAVVVIYWRSSDMNLALGTQKLTSDAATRYALPLTTAVTLLLAGLFASLPATLARLRRGLAPAKPAGAGRGLTSIVAGLVALLLVVYAAGYVASDNARALRSPESLFTAFPGDDAGLLLYLDSHHIHYAWGDYWICQLVLYLNDQRVVCGDWVGVYGHPGHQAPNRFPEAITTASQADRPSFIFKYDPTRGESDVARALDALGVTYTQAAFGPYQVITPASRTVQPQEIAAALAADT
jgi:hypothetical protein